MFYNPAMAMDRDLGVAWVRAWYGGTEARPSGWEMTAATGVRALRLIGEGVPFAAFTLTESNPEAARVLAANSAGRAGVRVLEGDARSGVDGGPFDYVDLDPYGSPVPFVGAALAAVRPGGVLAVTATDLMVLAGAQPAACRRIYGADPVRGRLGPEGGLRVLLAFLAARAGEQGRAVRPVLSYVLDHHVRTYVVVGDRGGPAPVDRIDPATWAGPDLGPGGPFGPMWLGPIQDPVVSDRIAVPPQAAQPVALRAFLERLRDEAGVDVPFYYEANQLARALRLPRPRALSDLLTALRARGYRAARTHARPEGFRTDAPRPIVEREAAPG